jgi:transposase
MNTNITKISFKGQVLYIGMDVHKKGWSITILSKSLCLKRYSQESKPEILINHLQRHYPGATYKCVYEAGYSGFWIAEALIKAGIDCIVVNAADIPTTNKQKDRKTDKADSKKLAEFLRAGLLRGIYIPSRQSQEDRSLIRVRGTLVRMQTAAKNRIKSFLSFYGIRITDDEVSKHWSKNYLKYLNSIRLTQQSGQLAFESLLKQLNYLRGEILLITRKIRELAGTEKYKDNVRKLISVPGIGILNALLTLTEIADKKRFSGGNKFRGFIGLVPREHSSGEKQNKTEMSRRGNNQIKSMLIESAWVAVRRDPAMTLAYEELCKRMTKSRAIIRIARKLANRILHILNSEEEYVLAVA